MRISDWSSDVCSSDLRETSDVDLAESAARGLPRPSARAFAQASALLADAVACDHHASAIFDGGGGDNMFGSLQSPAPVVDCLRSDGGAGHFWQTARSIGIAAQTSTFDVARRALLRRSEEHTSELQSLLRISYAVFCLKK